jgi:hypothetical protein
MENDLQRLFFEFLSARPIAFNPKLARVVGGVKAGLFLSQLLYWDNKGKSEDGWIYKTIDEMEEETALSREEQDAAIRKLKSLDIIEVTVKGVPPKRHFRLKLDILFNLCKTHILICVKPTNRIVSNAQIEMCETHKLDSLIFEAPPYTTTENTTNTFRENISSLEENTLPSEGDSELGDNTPIEPAGPAKRLAKKSEAKIKEKAVKKPKELWQTPFYLEKVPEADILEFIEAYGLEEDDIRYAAKKRLAWMKSKKIEWTFGDYKSVLDGVLMEEARKQNKKPESRKQNQEFERSPFDNPPEVMQEFQKQIKLREELNGGK